MPDPWGIILGALNAVFNPLLALDPNPTNPALTVLVIAFIVLAAVCGSLFLRAEISSLKAQINGVNKEIVELESEATRLEVEIERKVSLVNLEQAATELGMQKCSKNQVIYIKTNGFDTAETQNGKLTAELE